MSGACEKLRIGFIPLADSASLLLAIDKGFASGHGLEIEAKREVSWANVREKLNAGLFDAAHMLAPMAIASTVGVSQRTPLLAPFVLAMNGNAITVSPPLYDALLAETGSGPLTPLATARALAKVVHDRRRKGAEPLTFGMTFPFSCHNYQLRFWMAAGGIDPDEDVRLIVLPPPYMVESLTSGQVDGFCVGAPWNSVAVELGVGRILHFGSEIVQRLTEKVLAVRAEWAAASEAVLIRLMKALAEAAAYAQNPENWDECADLLSKPDRIGVKPELIRRILSGALMAAPGVAAPSDRRYLMLGEGQTARPDSVQAAWLYSQMVRWKQATLDSQSFQAACDVFAPSLFGKAFAGAGPADLSGLPSDGLGAFAGPSFSSDVIATYLAQLRGK